MSETAGGGTCSEVPSGQPMVVSAAAVVAYLDGMADLIGTGAEPDGLCANRADHKPHLHDSDTLGRFWCTADQADREPWRSERRRGGAAAH